jgi:hypothetical protein
MTVPELITRILHMLESQFYGDCPRRDFRRDERFLVAAIGTYGYECDQRGWEFDVEFLHQELCRLLTSFKRSRTEVTWMPIYLQTAIRQHIREHAEELSARARAVAPAVKRVVSGVKMVEVVREATATQLAAAVYEDVRKLRKRAAAARRHVSGEARKQGVLL